MRTYRLIALVMFLSLPLATRSLVAATTYSLGVTLTNLDSHDIYYDTSSGTAYLDPQNPPDYYSPTLPSRSSATWTVQVTNGTASSWTDFHIQVTSQLSGVELVPNVTVTGWGSLPQQTFTISTSNPLLDPNDTADFVAPTGQVVAPNSTITLSIPVTNFNATLGLRHHMHFTATVPEPQTLALLTFALIPLLRRRRAIFSAR